MLVNETRLEEATSDVPCELLRSLTRSPEKVATYRFDPYFRHGARQVSASTVLPMTFVVIKPDAIVGRRALTLVDELVRSGFMLVDAWRFRLTPALVRELWRYQYNVASWPRIEVVAVLALFWTIYQFWSFTRKIRVGGRPPWELGFGATRRVLIALLVLTATLSALAAVAAHLPLAYLVYALTLPLVFGALIKRWWSTARGFGQAAAPWAGLPFPVGVEAGILLAVLAKSLAEG